MAIRSSSRIRAAGKNPSPWATGDQCLEGHPSLIACYISFPRKDSAAKPPERKELARPRTDNAPRLQTVTARYNFTDDWRDITSVGEALFSSIRSDVRAQNFSFFLNSKVSSPASTRAVFNQVRLSYGRTRLNFEELRDQTFLRPSD